MAFIGKKRATKELLVGIASYLLEGILRSVPKGDFYCSNPQKILKFPAWESRTEFQDYGKGKMRVHKLDDLNLEAPPGKRLVVLGDPIGHSLSPVMHNAALAKMAESNADFTDWGYEAVHVPASDLKKALPLLHNAGVVGINLTIPHKVDVLGIIEEIDETARSMGAVNTLIRTDEGYRGSNTDGYGILKGLEASHGTSVNDKDVWLFGAGGAARGILVAVLQSGARRVTVVNRSVDRLSELEESLSSQSLLGLERVRFCPLAECPGDPEPDAILINATSLGLKAEDPSPIPESFIDSEKVVYDTTYGTANQLAELCRARRAPYADGLSMLIWQGVRSLEIWTGEPVPAESMRRAVEDEMNRRKANG